MGFFVVAQEICSYDKVAVCESQKMFLSLTVWQLLQGKQGEITSFQNLVGKNIETRKKCLKWSLPYLN